MLDKVMRKNDAGEFEEVALPAFECHKVVRAAKIVSIAYVGEKQYRLSLSGGLHVDVTQNWVLNKGAVTDGYYVQYEDGYASFSPAVAFETGYTPIEAAAEASPVKGTETDEAQGSGSERHGAEDWTQAGDGTDYPDGAATTEQDAGLTGE
jgi:hypothetical protein